MPNRMRILPVPDEDRERLERRARGCSRSAQQDNHIEPRTVADLVLLAPGDEQRLRILDGKQLLDGVLPPPLAAVRQRRAPPVVGIGGLVPAGSKRLDNTGLPVPDMPVSSTRFTVASLRPQTGLPVRSCSFSCGSPQYRRMHAGPAKIVGPG